METYLMSIFAYSSVHVSCKNNNQYQWVDLCYRGEYEFLYQIFFNVKILNFIETLNWHTSFLWRHLIVAIIRYEKQWLPCPQVFLLLQNLPGYLKERERNKWRSLIWKDGLMSTFAHPLSLESPQTEEGMWALTCFLSHNIWIFLTFDWLPPKTMFLPAHSQLYETKHRRIMLVLKPTGGGQYSSHHRYCYKQNNDIGNIIWSLCQGWN